MAVQTNLNGDRKIFIRKYKNHPTEKKTTYSLNHLAHYKSCANTVVAFRFYSIALCLSILSLVVDNFYLKSLYIVYSAFHFRILFTLWLLWSAMYSRGTELLFFYPLIENQFNHRFTTNLQRRIYGHATDVEIRPLNEDKAVQAASDLIGEIFIFTVVIDLSLPDFQNLQESPVLYLHCLTNLLFSEYEQKFNQ